MRLNTQRQRRTDLRITRRRLGSRFEGRLLPHEPPLVAAVLAVLVALVLLAPAVAPFGSHRSDGEPVGPLSDSHRPVADEGQGERHGALAGALASKTPAPDVPTRRGAGCPAPYPAPYAALAPGGATAAVSADEAGRFRLYGAPDPESGLTGRDSYDLLRGCASAEAAIVWLNPVRVGVTSARTATLGPEALVGKTREAGSDAHPALVTTYRTPGGLFVTQSLSVVRVQGRFDVSDAPDTLRASYSLRNGTKRPVQASLSAVLTPARGPDTAENSGVPYLANHPPDGPGPAGGVSVTSAGVLSARRGDMSKEIIVPRPGAASSATSYWRPASPKDAPDRLVFASTGELTVGPVLPIDPGGPLTDSSSFAAVWRGLEIPPRGSRTLSYEYGQTSGWPGP